MSTSWPPLSPALSGAGWPVVAERGTAEAARLAPSALAWFTEPLPPAAVLSLPAPGRVDAAELHARFLSHLCAAQA